MACGFETWKSGEAPREGHIRTGLLDLSFLLLPSLHPSSLLSSFNYNLFIHLLLLSQYFLPGLDDEDAEKQHVPLPSQSARQAEEIGSQQPVPMQCGPLCRLTRLQPVEMVRRTFKEKEMAQAKAQRLDWAEHG